MHSRAGCQYHQQAINSSQSLSPSHHYYDHYCFPTQTKHTKAGDQLAASNPIINTPRLDNTRPAKNYEYSSSLISAETNRVLADKEMHKTPNPDISISRDQKKIHNFLILHGHRICTNKMQKGVKEGLGLSILPRPDGFSEKAGENHSAFHLLQISISKKDYFHFSPQRREIQLTA